MRTADRKQRPLGALGAGTVAFVILHTMAAIFFPGSLWGFSQARYLPPALQLVFGALALFLVAVAWGKIPSGRFAPRRPAAGRALLAAGGCAGVAIFVLLRSRNLFLGDGYLIEKLVSGGGSDAAGRAGFGSVLLYGATLRAIRLFMPSAGGAAPFVLLNPLVGVIGLFLAAALARELTAGTWGRIILFFAFAFPAILLFWFGYVEDYALMHIASAGAMLLMIRSLRGRGGIAAPLALLALAVALHLSAVVFFPAYLIAFVGSRRSPRARATLGAILVLGAIAGSIGVLRYTQAGYKGAGALLPLFRSGSHAFTLLSAPHLRFLLNEIVLILGGALLLPFLAGGARRKGKKDPAQSFLVILALSGLVYMITIDPLLGSRDWDLMSLPVVAWIALMGRLFLAGRADPPPAAVLLVAGACVLHTMPWVVVNSDKERGLAMTLDMVSRDGHYTEPGAWANRALGYLLLEKGYTDEAAEVAARSVAVAGDARDYYGAGVVAVRRGDLEAGEEWFRRAIDVRPNYDLPYHELASLYMDNGRLEEAETLLRGHLETASTDARAWYLLGLVLGRTGRVDESIEAVETSVKLDSSNAEAWGTLGVGRASVGRAGPARRALEKSLELDPTNERVRAFLESMEKETSPAGGR